MTTTSTFNNKWLLAEGITLSLTLIYFFCYPRDTLADFVVLTINSFLLWNFANHLKLAKAEIQVLGKKDALLAIITIVFFLSAWIYAFYQNKVDESTAFSSICITIVYFYYAWIQHYLAQRYLALKMLGIQQKIKGPGSTELRAALATGVIFGLLHLPYPHLILVSMLGGFMLAYYYLTSGRLWAVVVAHALVASASLYWYLDDNPFTELWEFLFL